MHLHEQQSELAAPQHATTREVQQERAEHLDVRSPTAALSPSSVIAMQRSVGNASTTQYLQREEQEQASPVHSAIKSGGAPLDRATRSTMEQHLGADFSDVRLHVDAKSAESVKAAAYTVGNDIVVHPNHFAAGSVSAQRTLAHELTHVKQQRSGPVEGTMAPGGVKVSTPTDRFEREAESNATAFMQHSQASSTDEARRGHDHDHEGEGSLQRLTVQRQEESEEESEEG